MSVDLRGHGESNPHAGISATGFVADVLAASRAAGVGSAILVGHSMGGRVALAVARAHPQLVRGLVLLDVAVAENPDYVAERRRQLDGPEWPGSLRGRIENLWMSSDAGDARHRATEVMLATPREVAIAALEASDDIDAAGALSEYRGPVLYIGASAPREQARTLEALNSDITYAQVVGSGHFVQLDAARQVNPMIDRYCALHWPSRRATS